jgi:hypothetical protein
LRNAQPFFCQDIKKVLQEKDKLRQQIEEIQKKQDADRAQYEAQIKKQKE